MLVFVKQKLYEVYVLKGSAEFGSFADYIALCAPVKCYCHPITTTNSILVMASAILLYQFAFVFLYFSTVASGRYWICFIADLVLLSYPLIFIYSKSTTEWNSRSELYRFFCRVGQIYFRRNNYKRLIVNFFVNFCWLRS